MNKMLTYRSIRQGGKPVVYMAEDSHVKTASEVCPSLLDALSKLGEPEKDMVRTVVTALSSHEAFGPNRNGDAFFEDHLLRPNTYEVGGEKKEVPMHESFTHFARPYKYHNNKEHSPAYGEVLSSVYNPDMRRVELIVEVDKSKAPKIVEKIENYEPVSTSMGFRCQKGGDVCSVCGNVAKSRRQYCDHLKKKMLEVMPNGQRVYAINPWGKFFDISFVDDPADATSRAVWVDQLPVSMQEGAAPKEGQEKEASFWTPGALSADLAIEAFGENAEPKVASYGGNGGGVSDGKQAADKKANPVKRIPADLKMRPEELKMYRKALQNMRGERMSKSAMDLLASYGLQKAASSTAVAGIDLYPEEAQYIALANDFPKVASSLLEKNALVDTSSIEPSFKEAQLSPEHIEPGILEAFAGSTGFLEKRSMRRPWLMDGIEKRARNPYVPASAQRSPQEAIQEAPQDYTPEPESAPAEDPNKQTTADNLKERLGGFTAFMAGAQLLLGGGNAKSVAEQYPELVAGLVGARSLQEGYRRGNEIRENNRMPITRKVRQKAQDGDQSLGGLMNSPMAYQMFMSQPQTGPAPRQQQGGSGTSPQAPPAGAPAEGQGFHEAPTYEGGLLSRSLSQSKQASKMAKRAIREADVTGYEKHASNGHLPITPEVADAYKPGTIDADLVYRYANA